MEALEGAFARHRRELHVHCYRMLASYDDAEDAVQETFLRAWRSRDSFDGEHPRAWLYRIATNVCLDRTRARRRRARDRHAFAEVPGSTPYPDGLLDEYRPVDDEPDPAYVDRETIELAFLAAMQVLPPRQRATLLVARRPRPARRGDRRGCSAPAWPRRTAPCSGPAHDARARPRTARTGPPPSPPPTGAASRLVHRRPRALRRQGRPRHRRPDLRSPCRRTPGYDGLSHSPHCSSAPSAPTATVTGGLLPTSANRMPTAASYLRRHGDRAFRAFKLDVLRIEGDRIAEITTFGPALFEVLRLPAVLDA